MLRSKSMIQPLFICSFAIYNIVVTTAFQPILKTHTHILHASKNQNEIQRPQNEFSRSINVDAVLNVRRRDYLTNVEAKEEELTALALRFHLPQISKLACDLTLKKDSPGRRRTGTSGNSEDTLYVEGDLSSTLTQTCVRTNDDFEVDLEFTFFAAVRAINWRDRQLLSGLVDDDDMEMENSKSSNYQSRSSNNKGKKSKRQNRNAKHYQQGTNLDDMGMMELQNLMMDFDFAEEENNDLIEDDAVYRDGILDAGELVAQIFRSKLDPYPKKPGSEPVKISISG